MIARVNLTAKQEGFCLSYFETGEVTASYQAHYDTSRMKHSNVKKCASELLADPKVAARIQQLRDEAAAIACITEAQVLAEAGRIGFSDPATLFDVDGNLLDIKKMTPETRAAIASIEIDEEKVVVKDAEGGTTTRTVSRVRKVKLWDKNSALEKLMKHMGMFERDNKQRAGIFDKIPRETLKMIEEKLRALYRSDMAGATSANGRSRITH